MIQAKRDRPAWPLFLIILLMGICFMLAAGQVAIQLVPTWSLIADVDSNIDPNDQLVKWSDSTRLEPVSAEILTQPAWRATYLTPGASIFVPPIVIGIPTSTSEANNTQLPPPTQEPGVSVTPGQPTAVSSSTPIIIIIIPTSTSVPPTRTKAPTKVPTDMPTVTPTGTGTATVTATSTIPVTTYTPTSTGTATLLAFTETPTETATSTSVVVVDTETPTATALPACKNTIDLNAEPNPHPVSPVMTCFTYTNTDSAYNKGAIFQIGSTGVDGNVHAGCTTKSLIPGGSIDYGVPDIDPINPGGVMVFRINVITSGTLTIAITPWSGFPCP
jgi:hypothetical protein